MKRIKLSRNKYTLVDNENFDYLNQWKWCISGAGYAQRGLSNHKYISMHRLIMKAKEEKEVDHKNGNTLDNRRRNLRLCTRRQNSFNRPKQSNNKSGFKGVTWHKASKKWRATIGVGRKYIHFGTFTVITEAAKVYRMVAKQLHGEFARSNEWKKRSQ